jgi:hypothetical protein
VEDGQDANPSAEMLRIGCDGEHGLGWGLEQQVVDHGLVLIGDVGDPSRQGEYDLIVRDRQQLRPALGQPFARRRAPRLRGGRLWHFGQCRLRQEL